MIDNVVEKRPFAEIIRGESIDADLTVLGLSDLREAGAARFVEDTNSIVDVLGTVVLVRASSYFGEPLVRSAAALRAPPSDIEPLEPVPPEVPADVQDVVDAPESITSIARTVDHDLRADVHSAHEAFIHRVFEADRAWLRDMGQLAAGVLADLAEAEGESGQVEPEALANARETLASEAFARIERERGQAVAARAALLTGFGDRLDVAVAARRHHAPETLDVVPDADPEAVEERRGWFAREPGHRTLARLLLESRLRSFAAHGHGALLGAVSAAAARNTALGQRWIETALGTCTATERLGGTGGSVAVRASIQAEALRNELADALRDSAEEEARFVQSLEAQAVAAVVAFARDANVPEARRMERTARETDDAARGASKLVDESIDAFPDALRLLLNGTETGLRLALARDRVQSDAALARSELRVALLAPTVERIERLSHVMGGVRGTLDEDAAGEVEAAAHYQVATDADSVLAGVRERLAALAAELPEHVEMIGANTDAALAEGRPEDVESLSLPVREVFDYVARTEVLAPLLDEAVRAIGAVEALAEVCREVAQLAAFELRPEEAARAVAGEAGADLVVRSGTERLAREVQRLLELEVTFDEAVRRRFEALVARLDPFSFSRIAARLQQYVRSEKGRGLIGSVGRWRRSAGRALTEQATRLAYRRSEGVLLARRLERDALEGHGPGVRVRRLVKEVSPRPDVLEALPAFYRQLFLGGATVSGDVSGFETELDDAANAVAAHRRGADGALFIAADQGHGRATLSALIAQRNFPRGAVYRLDPVEGGSVDPQVFERRLATALRTKRDDAARMIARLPAGSAVLINDLGLWWERSGEGGAVLDIVEDLIARLGNHVFFLVNANIHAFRLMTRMRPLDDRILALIELEPFHARELKELVLLRHGAGGLGYTIDGRPEASLSEWRLARFFDALFAYSNGNIGAALNTWIASIRELEDDTVHVVTPRRPGLDAFAEFGPVQRMIALQLVIHDQTTLERLVRITRLDRAVLAREVRVLQSCRLLRQKQGGALYIDRFVRPHFVRFLTQEGLL